MSVATLQEPSPSTATADDPDHGWTWDLFKNKSVNFTVTQKVRAPHWEFGKSYITICDCCGLPVFTMNDDKLVLAARGNLTTKDVYNKDVVPGTDRKQGMWGGYQMDATTLKKQLNCEDALSFEFQDENGTHSFIWYEATEAELKAKPMYG